MYRKRKYINKKMAAMREAKERRRLDGEQVEWPAELPELRRRVIVIDYDFGKVVHRMDLYKSDRVDCYRAVVNGVVWRERVGWSKVVEGIRKSFVRVLSPLNC